MGKLIILAGLMISTISFASTRVETIIKSVEQESETTCKLKPSTNETKDIYRCDNGGRGAHIKVIVENANVRDGNHLALAPRSMKIIFND